MLLSHSQIAERNAVSMHDASHIMIRCDKQVGGILEMFILGEPVDGHMTMWRDDETILNRFVQSSCDGSLTRICGEQAIFIERGCHNNYSWN